MLFKAHEEVSRAFLFSILYSLFPVPVVKIATSVFDDGIKIPVALDFQIGSVH